MTPFRFRPRLIDALAGYRREDFVADLSAGLTVGAVALPLAMAFGIASGVKPEAGLFTAIIAGFLISALGGSRVQIGGPAGAFVALLYGIVERYGVQGLLAATFGAGMLLFAMGALRLGNLIRYIPVPIIIGFTNGIAVIIALQQIKDLLGLSIPKMPAHFFGQLEALASHVSTINPAAVLTGLTAIAIIAAWPKPYHPNPGRWRRTLAMVPGTVVVLVLGTLAVTLFGLPVETIGTRFGGIPQSLPGFAMPAIDWEVARNLAGPILSIALLGAIESLLCARVADNMTDERHDPNQELMAQGIANIASPLFGGIAATGTIARTVTNVRSGARTPVAGMVHAATLLVVVLALAPLARDMPLAVLAAILLFVAFNMGEWKAFAHLRHYTLSYRIVFMVSFLLTVILDLTVAIEVGLVLACLFFIHRVSALTRVEAMRLPADLAQRPDGRRVRAYRIFGSLFFGSVTKLEQITQAEPAEGEIVVLEMHQVINLDTTGLDALQGLLRSLRRHGGRLILAEPTEQPLSLMRRSGLLDELGRENLFADLDSALQAARRAADGPLS
jgi:SulP family sulfate permease